MVLYQTANITCAVCRSSLRLFDFAANQMYLRYYWIFLLPPPLLFSPVCSFASFVGSLTEWGACLSFTQNTQIRTQNTRPAAM